MGDPSDNSRLSFIFVLRIQSHAGYARHASPALDNPHSVSSNIRCDVYVNLRCTVRLALC